MEPCDKEKSAHFDYSRLSRSFLALSKPAQRALINNGIFKPHDLARWSRADIAKLHGIGPTALPKLDEILRAEDLKFDE
ncbi:MULTISPECIES: hypothetical protein [Filomicrobium]|uniref:RNA polymerase alpha subunit C-terminal domain-containing protein n=1 Tax=Filomicrobium insigne TaxID=418854 RepID=A0A1H0I9F5_9HYPH|nr:MULTISPECIES: hypothetical protein [Filomicrobium]MCV0368124.1 hypothetical protein [Filomicrobium sp.]SDO28003.1 hypothetical protein SAMN04488061_0781 [Filomicrobium insigne]